jgi:hypothetical protein
MLKKWIRAFFEAIFFVAFLAVCVYIVWMVNWIYCQWQDPVMRMCTYAITILNVIFVSCIKWSIDLYEWSRRP